MPQITVNSNNINQFGFKATFDPFAKTVTFDTSGLTTYNDVSGSGFLYVLGICFGLTDQDGVSLLSPDWNNPHIQPASSETTYVLDLSGIGLDFFFQSYKITGYIQDGDGNIYSTTPVIKKVCQPVDITSSGYVSGVFQITADCPNNVLTVKEVTKTVYNNQEPDSKTKTGLLSYPTGTISAISFTGTPFTNNVIYTGQYRAVCTTVAKYNLGDDIYVDVTYYTNNVFDVDCSNKLQDIMCCIVDLQRTKEQNFNTNIGERAAQQLAEIEIPFLIALSKEMSGSDAGTEVAYIRKKLNCQCGGKSIIRNEFTPTNPSVSTITITGEGGTTVGTPVITGNTKAFTVTSSTYVVAKKDTGDTAFSITVDNSTANVVRYLILLDYKVIAKNVLDQISGDQSLQQQLNDLVSNTVSIAGLDGKCVINTSLVTYTAVIPSFTGVKPVNVIINGVQYNTPTAYPLQFASGRTGFQNWLNSLSLGTYKVVLAGNSIVVQTVNDTNVPTIVNLADDPSDIPINFVSAPIGIVDVMQALVNLLCALSDENMVLGEDVTLGYLDYNGQLVIQTIEAGSTQQALNGSLGQSILLVAKQFGQSFNNGLIKSGAQVQVGGDLIQDTTINQKGKFFLFSNDSGNYVKLSPAAFNTLYKQGSLSTDYINEIINNYGTFSAQIATKAARDSNSYYATAVIKSKIDTGVSISSTVGVNVPAANDGFSPPADAPNLTAYFRGIYDEVTDEPVALIYGKEMRHTGTVANFDSLLRVKRMTSAEIAAIDISLLVGGLLVYNTTTNKHQGYNGSTWNNLY